MNDEAAFRSNVKEALTAWRHRLVAPGAVQREGGAIGAEAAELRKIAQSRGWWQIAQHLGNVETLACNASPTLPEAVGALAGRLAPGDQPSYVAVAGTPGLTAQLARNDLKAILPIAAAAAPPQPPSLNVPLSAQSIALPPLLYDPGASHVVPNPAPAAPSSVPPPVGAIPAAGNQSPNPIVNSPPPPKFLVKDMLGLNAGWGQNPQKESRGDAALQGKGPLGLQKPKASTPAPQAASSPPAWIPPQLANVPGRQSSQAPAAKAVRPPMPRAPQRAVSRPTGPRAASNGVPRWFYGVAGAVGLLAVAMVLTVVLTGSSDDKRSSLEAGVSVDSGPRAPPPSPETPDNTVPPPITAEVHNFGEETPALRAVIDAQSRLAAKCRKESPECRGAWTAFAQETMDAKPITLAAAPPPEPLSAWLTRLKKPKDFPLTEHPLLKGTFDYDSRHVRGHPDFQATLRRCSAYSDIIEGALLKYGAPTWLIAVVYQESQCVPTIKSPAGALGLWQFMPESAKGYGLRVVDDEVDERLSPVKSTDAGVRFLTDLYRKLGSWDLALAAYNVGPYGVTARLARVGGKAGFWDLVRSGLLPEETARYVPAIEAHALVLQNLASLNFDRGGAPKENAGEVRVKAGTRLSLVARAANTSTQRIHELNLDFLQELVPNGETAVRVPDSEVQGAQEVLDTYSPSDRRDTCVPKNFDWGKTDFDTSPYAKACGGHGQTAPAP
jgi:hypothetical protein